MRETMDMANSHKDIALAWLFIGAVFFAMRSWKVEAYVDWF